MIDWDRCNVLGVPEKGVLVLANLDGAATELMRKAR
jgi:hypothetical protein